MKKLLIIGYYLLSVTFLRSQTTVEVNSGFLLGLTNSCNVDDCFNVSYDNKHEIKIIPTRTIGELSEMKALIWSKRLGLITTFENIQFVGNQAKCSLLNIELDSSVIISIFSDTQLISSIPFENWKISSKQNSAKKIKLEYKFCVHDNFRANKDLGSINSKIGLGETFAVKFGLKINDEPHNYKIWFKSNQPGLNCLTDTIRRKGNFIIDSVIFNAPFQYPKYGNVFKISAFFLDLSNNTLDSSLISLKYDNQIPFEYDRNNFRFTENANVQVIPLLNEEKKVSEEVILSDENFEINLNQVGQLQFRNTGDLSLFDFNFEIYLIGKKDSIQIKLQKNEHLKLIDIPTKIKFQPYSVRVKYVINERYRKNLSIGFLVNSFEFRNSSSMKMPIGLSLGFRKKHGFQFYFMSNFNVLEADFTVKNENSVFPIDDFTKVNYNSTNDYNYSLIEMGLIRDFRINETLRLLIGARYSNFKYASILKKTDVVSNMVTNSNIILEDYAFNSIDPLLGLNVNLSKNISLGVVSGTRNLKGIDSTKKNYMNQVLTQSSLNFQLAINF